MISCVIPLYNKEKYIKRSVMSVLNQTYKNLELVVVDDGSTDNGCAIVEGIRDSRLRLIKQMNGGECAARNRGIREAKYEYVAFLDADDEWLPHFLQNIRELLKSFPECGIYCTSYYYCINDCLLFPRFKGLQFCKNGEIVRDYYATGLGDPVVTASSSLIPKKVFRDVGLFPVGISIGGDLHMWYRIAAKYKVCWHPYGSSIYNKSATERVSNTVTTPRKDEAFAIYHDSLVSRHVPVPRSAHAYADYFRLRLAVLHLLSNNKREALSLIWKARGARGRDFRFFKSIVLLLLPHAIIKFLHKRIVEKQNPNG